jgi:hypothetical protein
MSTRMRKFKLLRLVLPFAAVMGASLTASAQTARYTFTDNDTAVVDSKTGLVWKRCQEGKHWENGVCKGLGIKFTWSDAERLSSNPWRLPTVDELKSLKNDTGVAPPINREVFPNTDRAWFWTSSAGKRDADGCIQNVYFGDDIDRRCPTIRSNNDQLALKPAYVRLVRTAQ